MNDVVISATLKGGFEEISNDGVQFTLVSRGGNPGTPPDEFPVLAYGNSAKFLRQHASSGDRVVVQGRLSSEKLNTDSFHTAITANRVLSISEASQGIDYTKAVVSGRATCEGVRTVGENSRSLAGFNIQNERRYVTKSGEERVYTTYLGATLWGDRAVDLQTQGLIPIKDENLTVEGILKPRTYTNRDGQEVRKMDIWIDDIVFAQAQSSPDPRPRRQNTQESSEGERAPAPQQTRNNTRSVDSSPF